jgi:hypothetical protein
VRIEALNSGKIGRKPHRFVKPEVDADVAYSSFTTGRVAVSARREGSTTTSTHLTRRTTPAAAIDLTTVCNAVAAVTRTTVSAATADVSLTAVGNTVASVTTCSTSAAAPHIGRGTASQLLLAGGHVVAALSAHGGRLSATTTDIPCCAEINPQAVAGILLATHLRLR